MLKDSREKMATITNIGNFCTEIKTIKNVKMMEKKKKKLSLTNNSFFFSRNSFFFNKINRRLKVKNQ